MSKNKGKNEEDKEDRENDWDPWFVCAKCYQSLGENFEKQCCYCRNCPFRICTDCCTGKVYECKGSNHYFTESCCEICMHEYGRIVDNCYFCPACCTGENQLEHRFKRAAYLISKKVTRKYRVSTSIDYTYLNDPNNWARYDRHPERMEKELWSLCKAE